MQQQIKVVHTGRVQYADALQLQTDTFDKLVNNKIQGISNAHLHQLFLCEHEPVITLGKAANAQNILLPEEMLQEKGIEVFHINRGGDVTFHGPGQITGYPILDLDFFTSDLKQYMRLLEEVMIQTIATFGISGYRIEDATGVWVDSKTDGKAKKIAAFGVKTSRWVTMHGFALNINNNLDYFHFINPCGFTDKGVTSIALETGNNAQELFDAVEQVLITTFAAVFNAHLYTE